MTGRGETESTLTATHPTPPPDALCIELGLRSCAAQALNRLPSGLALCDEDGVVLFLNQEGGRILGKDPGKTIGRNIADLMAPLERILELPPDPERDGTAKVVTVGSGAEVRIFGVSTTEMAGLLGEPASRQQLLVFRDITRLEATRRERDRLLRMATIARLLPTVAHEIRNPLAGIQSLVELLLKGEHDASTREDLELIQHEVERLRLIVQGLDFESGTILQPGTHIDLAREAREVIRLVRGRFEQSRVALELSVEGSAEMVANGPVFRLVLLNLLNNALEACAPGDSVLVRLRPGLESLEMEVQDTGSGMDGAVIPRVTDLFFSTKARGSGIGLALVDRVVSGAGGRLEIESATGCGTAVRVIIPKEAR